MTIRTGVRSAPLRLYKPILAFAAVLAIAVLALSCIAISDDSSSDTSQSGKIGDLTWTFKEGALTVRGGSIPDYPNMAAAPWYDIRSDVEYIYIGDGVVDIGDNAFAGMNEVKHVDFGTSVKTIGRMSFSLVPFDRLVIPDTVTSVGASAFTHSYIHEVHIGKNVQSIGSNTFQCYNLKKITVDSANQYMKSVGATVMSKDGTKILCYVPESDATVFTIPDGVTEIAYPLHNANVRDLNIPASLSKLCYGAFDFSGLRTLNLDSGNKTFVMKGGVMTSPDGKTIVYFPDSTATSYTVPDGVETIGTTAFYGRYNLTSVTISDSVASIGDGAFTSCRKLASVTIPAAVIGSNAFAGCSKLASVEFANPVESIGSRAFSNTGLTSVTIRGAEGSVIGAGAFATNGSLARVTIQNVSEIGEEAFMGMGSGLWKKYERSTVGVSFNGSIGTIGARAFANANITSVNLPDGVTSIGEGAFADAAKLIVATIPSSVAYIASDAFGVKFADIGGKELSVSADNLAGFRFTGRSGLLTKTNTGFSFETNGGSRIPDMIGIAGRAATAPEPVKTNCEFEGWYSDSGLTSKYTIEKYPSRLVTLYAKWSYKTCTVTLDGNGGPDSSAQAVCMSSGISSYTEPSRTGYVLAGYCVGPAGGSQVMDSSGTLLANAGGYTDSEGRWTHDGDAVLYAKWLPLSYPVRLDGNGGSDGSASVVMGSSVITIGTDSVRDGYGLAGYCIDPEGHNTVINSDGSLAEFSGYVEGGVWVCANDALLYAKWAPLTCKVALNANGGAADGSFEVEYGTSDVCAFSTVAREGYDLSGFFTSADGGSMVSDSSGMLAAGVDGYTDSQGRWVYGGDAVLYAQWAAETCDVVLDRNGGASNGSATFTFGSSGKVWDHPLYSGFAAAGYCTMPSCSIQVLESDGTLIAGVEGYTDSEGNWVRTGETRLYTDWEPEIFTVTFDVNGGDPMSQTMQDIIFGSAYTLPVPTRAGMHFAGWKDEAGVILSSHGIWGLFDDTALTAQWSDTENVEMVFKGGEGATGPYYSIYAAGGSSVNLPGSEFHLSGHVFAEWSCGGQTYPAGEVFTAADAEFTALWTVKSYELSYVLDGVKLEGEYAPALHGYGESVTLLPVPVADGYDTAGWSCEYVGVLDGKITMPEYDVQMVAFTTPHVYSLYLEANGGGADGFAMTVYGGGETSYLLGVEKEGYALLGYYTEPEDGSGYLVMGYDGGFQWGVDGYTDNDGNWVRAEDTTLYAKWVSEVRFLTVNYIYSGGAAAAETYFDILAYGEGYSVESPAVTGYVPDIEKVEGSLTEYTKVIVTYSPREYTITFDSCGGTTADPLTQNYGSYVVLPAGITRDGYAFKAWLLDGEVFSENTMPAENLALTASWVPVPVVSGGTAVFVGGGDTAVIDLGQSAVFDIISDDSVTGVTVTGGGWSMDIPKGIVTGGGSTVTAGARTLSQSEIGALSDDVRAAVAGRTVYSLSLSDEYGTVDFSGNEITVHLPVQLDRNQSRSGLTVLCVNDEGQVEEVSAEYESGCLVFTTDHFSLWCISAPEGGSDEGTYAIAVCVVLILAVLACIAVPRRKA